MPPLHGGLPGSVVVLHCNKPMFLPVRREPRGIERKIPIMTTAYADLASRSHVSDVAAGVRGALGRWLEYRRTVAELKALSNRMLADLGLHRGEIRAAARREVYGR